MKELLETLVKAIVDDPDAVQVTVIEDERGQVLELRVAPEDMGKVIGKKGRVVNALRQLVRAAATRQGKTATVTVVE